MKEDNKVNEIIICDCYSVEHQMVISYDKEDKEKDVFISVHLVNKGFWRRLRYGVRYIFGYRCRFGAFDEIILGTKEADKLQAVVDFLKEKESDRSRLIV